MNVFSRTIDELSIFQCEYKQNKMYLQCSLISRSKNQSDYQVSKLRKEIKASSYDEVYQNSYYKSHIRNNKNHLDSQLFDLRESQSLKLKNALEKIDIKYVLVSPLKADLQSCYHIYGNSDKVNIIVDPSLAPRVISMACISQGVSQIIEKFKKKPETARIDENPRWYSKFGKFRSEEVVPGEDRTFQECVEEIKHNQNFESKAAFYQRILAFKKSLTTLLGKNKEKIAIIAHPELLQALTSTGCHEDFTNINAIPFEFSQTKSEFIWIEGVQGQLQTYEMPFCS